MSAESSVSAREHTCTALICQTDKGVPRFESTAPEVIILFFLPQFRSDNNINLLSLEWYLARGHRPPILSWRRSISEKTDSVRAVDVPLMDKRFRFSGLHLIIWRRNDLSLRSAASWFPSLQFLCLRMIFLFVLKWLLVRAAEGWCHTAASLRSWAA